MSRLGASVLNELPILSVDEMIERIDAVDIDDLRELAAELFAPERPVGRRRRARRGEFHAAIEPLGARCAPGAQRVRRRRAMIRVAVAGAAGRMGETVCEAVRGRRDMELVGRADPLLGTALAGRPRATPRWWSTSPRPDTALENALACLRAGRARRDRHHRL